MNWKTKELKGMFRHDDGRAMSGEEAKDELLNELSRGHNYLPFGECVGFDPIEKGCPGHADGGKA